MLPTTAKAADIAAMSCVADLNTFGSSKKVKIKTETKISVTASTANLINRCAYQTYTIWYTNAGRYR